MSGLASVAPGMGLESRAVLAPVAGADGVPGVSVLQAVRLAVLHQLCALPMVAWRPALAPLLAALLSAGLLLVWQFSTVREEAQAEQAKLQKFQSQLDDLRLRLAQHTQAQHAQPADEFHPASASLSGAIADVGPWHWRRLALVTGLTVDLLKPLEVGGARTPRQWQLRVRGHYHQHGAFVAALGEPTQAVRVMRYQLQSGPEGAHLADLHLELPAGPIQALPRGAPSGRSYHAAAGADPLVEPPPADPWAGVPAHWRAELTRPKLMLEASPLSVYALTGTLERGGEWLALLQGERMLHTVRVGDPLGPDAGRVLRIAEQGLWLREIVRDSQGRWSEQERLWRVGEKP